MNPYAKFSANSPTGGIYEIHWKKLFLFIYSFLWEKSLQVRSLQIHLQGVSMKYTEIQKIIFIHLYLFVRKIPAGEIPQPIFMQDGSHQCGVIQRCTFWGLEQVLSSSWDGLLFGHKRHGPKKRGLLCPLQRWGRASPSNTMSPWPKPPLYQVACW